MTGYACRTCGRPSAGRYCDQHADATGTKRSSPWKRGYQTEFRRNRDILLADNPNCVICGERAATVADHKPPRRRLVVAGVLTPDALVWLYPVCDVCHAAKTNRGN